MPKQDKTHKLVKKKKWIGLILLIPLLLAVIWLIMLMPSGADGMPSPYIRLTMIKGILLFMGVYGVAAMIFYWKMQ